MKEISTEPFPIFFFEIYIANIFMFYLIHINVSRDTTLTIRVILEWPLTMLVDTSGSAFINIWP